MSPISPIIPNREKEMPKPDGRLLPTLSDEFNDSVLGKPISYARLEQAPGSESPLSLPVYAWPPRATMRMDPIIQTVLSPPKRDTLPTGTTWVVPPSVAENARMTDSGIPGCLYRFLESDEPGLWFATTPPRFLELVGAPESARLLDHAPLY